jgi:hypothetical protein
MPEEKEYFMSGNTETCLFSSPRILIKAADFTVYSFTLGSQKKVHLYKNKFSVCLCLFI